jgi:hypothetical protein
MILCVIGILHKLFVLSISGNIVVWVPILYASLGKLVGSVFVRSYLCMKQEPSALCKSVKRTCKLPNHQQALPLIFWYILLMLWCK